MTDNAVVGPYRVDLRLEKYDGRDPDGSPDETLNRSSWHAADGTEITDPARIAALDTAVEVVHDEV